MHGILDRAAAASVTALQSNVVRVQTDGFDTNRPEHILYLGTQKRDRYMRYVGAAVYYRCDPPPADVAWLTNPDGTKRPNPAFLHFPNDANGTGGQDIAPGAATASNPRGGSWFRLEPSMGENDLYQYGGVQGGYNDFNTGALANWRAINDYMNFRASEWYHPNSILFIPAGWFAVDKPVIVKAGTIHLTGKREARDGAKSCLGFKDTDESFIVHYDNTSGDRTPAQQWEDANGGDRRSGSFTILHGFGIFNQAAFTKDYRAVADMILLRARATIQSMWLSGAPRHAIHVATSMGKGMDNPQGAGNDFAGGNANSTRITDNSIQWCGGSGIRCIGADSNAVLIFGNEENFCGHSGILEESFLGPNAVIANHTTDNGIGVGSTYAHGYKHALGADNQTKPGCYVWVLGSDGIKDVYMARAPGDSQDNAACWGRLVSTRPGTDESVWAFYSRDPQPGVNTPTWFSKEWLPNQPRGTYTWAGARIFTGVNNRSGSIFCYDEGSQPVAQFLNAFGMHRCQLSGSGIINGSVGDIRNDEVELSPRVIRQPYYDNDTKRWESMTVSIATIENGKVIPLMIQSSKWGDGFKVQYALEGKDLVTRINNNAEGRVAAIVGPGSSIAVDGSGRSFEAGTHLFGRMGIATTYYPGSWLGHRIVFRELHEIPGENSSFEELGVGDWVLPARANNPADPYDDNAAVTPNGWAGSVISKAPQGRGPKEYIRFGKLDDKVSGSAPPPPPPPPTDPSGATRWSSGDHDAGLVVSQDGMTATTTGSGHRVGRATQGLSGEVSRFKTSVQVAGDPGVGFASLNYPLSTGQPLGSSVINDGAAVVLFSSGWVQGAGVSGHLVGGASFKTGDTVAAQRNADGTVTFFVNDAPVFTGAVNLPASAVPAYDLREPGDSVTITSVTET